MFLPIRSGLFLVILCLVFVSASGQRRGGYQMPGRGVYRGAVQETPATQPSFPSASSPYAPRSDTVTRPQVPAAAVVPELPENEPIPPMVLYPGAIRFPEPGPGESSSTKTLTLCGDRRKPGPYTIRIRIPKQTAPVPHVHPDTRMSVVLSGTYYLGYGETATEEGAMELRPGTFFTEPAGVPHYGWTTDTEVVIQSSGYGPSGTRVLPASTASRYTDNGLISPSRRP